MDLGNGLLDDTVVPFGAFSGDDHWFLEQFPGHFLLSSVWCFWCQQWYTKWFLRSSRPLWTLWMGCLILWYLFGASSGDGHWFLEQLFYFWASSFGFCRRLLVSRMIYEVWFLGSSGPWWIFLGMDSTWPYCGSLWGSLEMPPPWTMGISG